MELSTYNIDVNKVKKYYHHSCLDQLPCNIIKEFFKKKDFNIHFFSLVEIKLLKAIIDKDLLDTQHNVKFKYVIQLLKEKYVVYEKNKKLYIFSELKEYIEKIVKKAYRNERELHLQSLCVGICNAYGILEKEKFLNMIVEYDDKVQVNKLLRLIKNSEYFFCKIAEISIGNVDYYCHGNNLLLDDYIYKYREFIDMPEKKLQYEQIKNYGFYSLDFDLEFFDDFIQNITQCCVEFNIVEFIEAMFECLNIDDNLMNVKVYIYNVFNHQSLDGKTLFLLLDEMENRIDEMPNWKTKGYPLKDLCNFMQEITDTMEKDLHAQVASIDQLMLSKLLQPYKDLDEINNSESFRFVANENKYN